MSAVTEAARLLGDALLAPFLWAPPLLAILGLSVAMGLLLLLAFRALTPQARLRRVKELMAATVYELRIFAGSPRRVLSAQGRALLYTFAYLGLALPSFVVLVPVLGVVFARAAAHYEFTALGPGEEAIVTATFTRPVAPGAVEVSSTGPGLEVRPPIVVPSSGRTAFVRVVARRPGEHRLVLRAGGQTVEKSVVACAPGGGRGACPSSPAGLSLARVHAGSLSLLLSQEAPLPAAGAVESLGVEYPEHSLAWVGLPWYVHLLIVSMVAALALRRRLGVVL